MFFKKVPGKPAVFDSYFFSLLSSTFPHFPRTTAREISLVNHSP